MFSQVATVLTVYGIETCRMRNHRVQPSSRCNSTYRLRYWNEKICGQFELYRKLQQYLPFTVLKLYNYFKVIDSTIITLQQYLPFTVLKLYNYFKVIDSTIITLQQYLPFTVLKPNAMPLINSNLVSPVATVLTVYGIETRLKRVSYCILGMEGLQQYLPFTVLKPTTIPVTVIPDKICCNSTYRLRYWNLVTSTASLTPWSCNSTYRLRYWNRFITRRRSCRFRRVATVLTVYGIETWIAATRHFFFSSCCNSTYRLRYWNFHDAGCHTCDKYGVATVLTVYGIET